MRTLTCKAARRYKLLFALTAVVFSLAVVSGAEDLAAIHLRGRIASDAKVGLAVSAPDTLYAASRVEGERDQAWQLVIYKFNATTGKVLSQSELDRAEPLGSRNGDATSSWVQLFLSSDGAQLLCAVDEGGLQDKILVLSTRDLHVISERVAPDATMVGFTRSGDVRLFRPHKGGAFGQEIDSLTVLDLSAQSLDKSVSEQTIRFQEPVWRLTAIGPGDLLWVLDERASRHGNPRVTAYSLQTGKPIATQEVSLAEARDGVPAAGPRPEGAELPAPTAIPQPGIPRDAPQLAQIVATSRGMLGVINQSPKDWAAWSRVVHIGASSDRVGWSSVLSGCNLGIRTVGRSGRIAVGSCDLIGRVFFDQYAIKKSDAVFVSTQSGSILAVIPLYSRRPPLSLAIDDTVRPALVAVYDQHATVRLLSLPQH